MLPGIVRHLAAEKVPLDMFSHFNYSRLVLFVALLWLELHVYSLILCNYELGLVGLE
jgi:hypothetical protein